MTMERRNKGERRRKKEREKDETEEGRDRCNWK